MGAIKPLQGIVFRPRARLLSLLGEQLISDQAVGLVELVKNAYDADATSVNIMLSGLHDPSTTRITLQGLSNLWGETEEKWGKEWLVLR